MDTGSFSTRTVGPCFDGSERLEAAAAASPAIPGESRRDGVLRGPRRVTSTTNPHSCDTFDSYLNAQSIFEMRRV